MRWMPELRCAIDLRYRQQTRCIDDGTMQGYSVAVHMYVRYIQPSAYGMLRIDALPTSFHTSTITAAAFLLHGY